MAFYSSNFIYDGIISSEYGLRISTFGGEEENFSLANVELITQSIYRKPKVFLLGINQTPVLEIPITITVPQELSAEETSVISRWLFGQMGYKVLQILQPDMQYIYFNCIFTEPEIIKIGNITRGFNAVITCDSPYAWEYSKAITYAYNPNNFIVFDNIKINNTSDNPDYTYPTVSFTMNKFGGYLNITNTSDSNRVFRFYDLLPNEVIEINNDLQTITSSTGQNRIENFNYYWFRYIPNLNEFIIEGNITEIEFTNIFVKKMM